MNDNILKIFVIMLLIVTIVLPTAKTIIKKTSTEYNLSNLEFAPGEFIIKLNKNIQSPKNLCTNLNEKYKVSAFERVFSHVEGTSLENIYLVHVPRQSDILSIVKEYAICSDVIYAEPNGIVYPCCIPNDAYFNNQWYLHNTGQRFNGSMYGAPDADIDAPETWDMEKGSSNIVIAIIDSGIDYTHPDLTANIWNNDNEIPGNKIDDDHNEYIDDKMGWSFVNNDNNLKDGFGHGTLCAGIAAAVTDNGIGIAGVCWNCKIMAVQVLNENGIGYMDDIANGIKYAVDNGANICSMSWIYHDSSLLKDVVDYAYNKSVFLCASAGNRNTAIKWYPAAYDHVVAVGATNQNDSRCTQKDWYFGCASNYGSWVDVAAPGNQILILMPTYHVRGNDLWGVKENYDYIWGTSLGAPMVAGVAALLLSIENSLNPDDIEELICDNVDAYNSTKYIGTGRLNAQKAIAALSSDININIIGGAGIKAIITNEGVSDISNIDCQIHVKGGILESINKTFSGTIHLKRGESQIVSIERFFGFGRIIITIRVDMYEKEKKGIQLLYTSIVK